MKINKQSKQNTQSGAALLTAVVILLALSILLMSGTTTAILEQKMAKNAHDQARTFNSADSASAIIMNDVDLLQTIFDSPNPTVPIVFTSEVDPIKPFPTEINEDGKDVTARESDVSVSAAWRTTHDICFESSVTALDCEHYKTIATAKIEQSVESSISAGYFRVVPE